MIPELGHFSLILAFLTASAQMHPLLARRAAIAQFTLCLFSFLCLTAAFVMTDLSVALVVQNSHSLKPWLYKFSGVWGNHEGSMLLWVLILSFFGFLLTRNSANKNTTVLQIMGFLGLGFLAYTLFASNPFERLARAPIDGQDLNPLLQDPALALHPPLLYLGYVGAAVAFAYALSGLWHRQTDKDWAYDVRPWILASWTALSAGIALGSWWAYYELGWGGWWFWDPVENAALIPWVLNTALLHSVSVTAKRDALKRWTVLLALLTFTTAMLGTFLVRSGVLTSVHAFALAPERGVFILTLIGVYSLCGFGLYAWRAPSLSGKGHFNPLSRETMLVLNNLFLATAAATILIGTLYPLALEAVGAPPVAVGPPYFRATVLPLAAPMLLLMAAGPLVPWKTGKWQTLGTRLRLPLLITGFCLLVVWAAQPPNLLASLLGMGLGVWLMTGTLQAAFIMSAGLKHNLGLGQWGMTLAHLGLGIAVIGMVGTNLWATEKAEIMAARDSITVQNRTVTLEKVAPVFGPNYSAARATLHVRPPQGRLYKLQPERRHYPVADKRTTEVAIRTGLSGDTYAALGSRDENGWVIRIWTHPLITFLWGGFAVITLGGILSLLAGRRTAK